jgi:hypothetical protein
MEQMFHYRGCDPCKPSCRRTEWAQKTGYFAWQIYLDCVDGVAHDQNGIRAPFNRDLARKEQGIAVKCAMNHGQKRQERPCNAGIPKTCGRPALTGDGREAVQPDAELDRKIRGINQECSGRIRPHAIQRSRMTADNPANRVT